MTTMRNDAPTGSTTSPSSRRSPTARLRHLAAAGAVVLLAVVGYVAWPTTTEVIPIESSYAYDVSNLRLLSGQASDVVYARVLDVAETDTEMGLTRFRVDITDVIKGNLSGIVVVEQLGYRDLSGKRQVIAEDPEQPLLRVGSEVLLTLGQEPDGRLVVIGGPRSVVEMTPGLDKAALRDERVRAARGAEPVRNAQGQVVLPVRERPIRD